MKKIIILTLVVLITQIVSAMNQPIKSLTLKCSSQKTDGVVLETHVQIIDGKPGGSVESLSLKNTDPEFNYLGQFQKRDLIGWSGNEMPSTEFKKILEVTGPDGEIEKYEEFAKFGFQDIGKITVGYLQYSNDAFEGGVETLVLCEKIFEY